MRWGSGASGRIYFGLNFAFFDVPWPWAAWTTRTIHAMVFFTCAVVLTRQAQDRSSATEARRPSGLASGLDTM